MPPDFLLVLKKIPFLRLLAALIAGILLQWYLPFSPDKLIKSCISIIGLLLIYQFLPSAKKFVLRWVQGICIIALFVICGAAATYLKDISHHDNWVGKYYKPTSSIIVTIEEPLVNKPKSYKALASVNAVNINNEWQSTEGKILLYLKKDSTTPKLTYGSQIVLKKPLQQITNSGNPGAFDYKRYCAFHEIYYQVFLQQKDYFVLTEQNSNWLQRQLYSIRNFVIQSLQKNIPGKKEQGVAEALLIGYRDDLDKDLVQSYSNTGVVHIIAISGLHLGMIYGFLIWLLSLFKNRKGYKVAKPVIILLVLWIFTLVAGAVPSILRSAVMFSFIVAGEVFSRKTNIYNTLAASAFCMLVFNPFFLWDVGFLLSYAAVVSIITFMKPIYNWLDFKNKLLDKLWQLNAVTISAQILTLPLILYYFHQFPNLFLITNLLVVPLSGLILFGELFLLLIAKFNWLAVLSGKVLGAAIWFMNSFIENIDRLPFALTDGIKITVVQAILLYGFIICLAVWLMEKMSRILVTALICITCFFALRTTDVIQHNNQERLVVYNVPQHTAIDIFEGNNYSFIGDTALLENNFLRNFHLKPSRILNRVKKTDGNTITDCCYQGISTTNKKIIILDKTSQLKNVIQKIKADVVIITKNPKLYMDDVYEIFHCNEVVFDSSNPLWKIEKWKKDCESLHLRFHSVPEEGAYETEL